MSFPKSKFDKIRLKTKIEEKVLGRTLDWAESDAFWVAMKKLAK